MEHFIKLYKKKKGKDLRKDVRAVQKLRREVEKAKRALSAAHQVRVEVESLFEGDPETPEGEEEEAAEEAEEEEDYDEEEETLKHQRVRRRKLQKKQKRRKIMTR